jgi:hypothetical protein
MKRIVTAVAIALALHCGAQTPGELPPVPAGSPTVDLHLDMAGDHLVKAGRARNTSMWFLVLGAAMAAANEAQREGNKYEEGITWGLAGIGAAGFVTFQLVSSDHEKKAGKALHRE